MKPPGKPKISSAAGQIPLPPASLLWWSTHPAWHFCPIQPVSSRLLAHPILVCHALQPGRSMVMGPGRSQLWPLRVQLDPTHRVGLTRGREWVTRQYWMARWVSSSDLQGAVKYHWTLLGRVLIISSCSCETGSIATRGSSALKWTVLETTFYLSSSFCYLPAHILQSPLLRPASYLLPEICPEILKPKGCFLGTGNSFYNWNAYPFMGLPRIRAGKPQKETERKNVTESTRCFINRKARKKTLKHICMRLCFYVLMGHFYS